MPSSWVEVGAVGGYNLGSRAALCPVVPFTEDSAEEKKQRHRLFYGAGPNVLYVEIISSVDPPAFLKTRSNILFSGGAAIRSVHPVATTSTKQKDCVSFLLAVEASGRMTAIDPQSLRLKTVYSGADVACTASCAALLHSSPNPNSNEPEFVAFAAFAEDGVVSAVSSVDGAIFKITEFPDKRVTFLHCFYTPSVGGGDDLILVVATSDFCLHFLQISMKSDKEFSVTVRGRSLTLGGAHTAWITNIASSPISNDKILLATSSLDRSIRIWKISINGKNDVTQPDFLSEAIEARRTFGDTDKPLSVQGAGLFLAHESGVSLVRFLSSSSPLRMLSAGLDRSVILWSTTSADAFDFTVHRQFTLSPSATNLGASVGEDHSMGFYWADSIGEEWIIAGQNGGTLQAVSLDFQKQQVIASGHTAFVSRLAWLPDLENILVSVSQDMTCRAWSVLPPSSSSAFFIREVARAQIHGYALNSLAFTKTTSENAGEQGVWMVSAADEKVIRVLRVPLQELNLRVKALENVQETFESVAGGIVTLPALGLTAASTDDQSSNSRQSTLIKQTLPSELELATSTLWPEVAKLYGHGNEVVAVATCQFSKYGIIASASRATRPEDARPRIWALLPAESAGAGFSAKQLAICDTNGPTLTCTALHFAPPATDDDVVNSRFLLACSRDRGWYVWHVEFAFASNSSNSNSLTELLFASTRLVTSNRSAHARSLHDCAWHTPQTFITCSRDRSIRFWKITKNGNQMQVTCAQEWMAPGAPCTACALVGDWLWVGTSDGCVYEHLFDGDAGRWGAPEEVFGGRGGGDDTSVTSIAPLPNGELLGIALADSSIHIVGKRSVK